MSRRALAAAAVTGLLATGVTAASAAGTSAAGTVTGGGPEDPYDLVFSAQLEDGRVVEASQWMLDEGAHGRADVEEKVLDEVVPRPRGRIQPALRRLLLTGDPGSDVEVVITYRDTLPLPVFPLPELDEGRETERNQDLLEQTRRLVEDIRARRAEAYAEQTRHVEALGGKPLDTYWLIQGVHAVLPLGAVRELAAADDVLYLELADDLAEPPADADPDNDLADARAQIRSDPYFNLGQTAGWIGLLDSGVRETHDVFTAPDHLAIVEDLTGDGDPGDQCDHGTASAAEITGNDRLGAAWRGVSAIRLDSWDIYGDDCLTGAADTVEGFQEAVAWLDKVIVAEVQLDAGETSAASTAADAAYDTGSVVIAANGNFGPGAGTVRSPGNAHKAIGIGAADLRSDDLMDYSGRGPTPDGRFKPDLVFPTNVETARAGSDTARDSFGGTSAATPIAGAAAALTRNWMRGGVGSIDAGHVYSHLILGGQTTWPFDNDTGAGPFHLGVNGHAWWSKTAVGQGGQVDVPIHVAPGRGLVEAALWWPEAPSRHNDVDLRLIAPDGSVADLSVSGASVFERATARATPGTWTLRITGFSVSGSQPVYWSARTS